MEKSTLFSLIEEVTLRIWKIEADKSVSDDKIEQEKEVKRSL